MDNDLKYILKILAVVILIVAIASIVLIVATHPNQQNTNTNPIVTKAPTPTTQSVDIKFSLWTSSGSAMQVASQEAYTTDDGPAYGIDTNPLYFTYTGIFSKLTFTIRNDGAVPINVTSNPTYPLNIPSGTNLECQPDNTNTGGYGLIIPVGQSATYSISTTLYTTSSATRIVIGTAYDFTLSLDAYQPS